MVCYRITDLTHYTMDMDDSATYICYESEFEQLIVELESVSFESDPETESGYNSAPGSVDHPSHRSRLLDCIVEDDDRTDLSICRITGAQSVRDTESVGCAIPSVTLNKVQHGTAGTEIVQQGSVSACKRDMITSPDNKQTLVCNNCTVEEGNQGYGLVCKTAVSREMARSLEHVDSVTRSKDVLSTRDGYRSYFDVTRRPKMTGKDHRRRPVAEHVEGEMIIKQSCHHVADPGCNQCPIGQGKAGRVINKSTADRNVVPGHIDTVNSSPPGLCGQIQLTNELITGYGTRAGTAAQQVPTPRKWTDSLTKRVRTPEIHRGNPFRESQSGPVTVGSDQDNATLRQATSNINETHMSDDRLLSLPVEAAITNISLTDDTWDGSDSDTSDVLRYMEKHSDGDVGLYPTVIRKAEYRVESKTSLSETKSVVKSTVSLAACKNRDNGINGEAMGKVTVNDLTAQQRETIPESWDNGRRRKTPGIAGDISCAAGLSSLDKTCLMSNMNYGRSNMDQTHVVLDNGGVELDKCPHSIVPLRDSPGQGVPSSQSSYRDSFPGSSLTELSFGSNFRSSFPGSFGVLYAGPDVHELSFDNVDEILANCSDFDVPEETGRNSVAKFTLPNSPETLRNNVITKAEVHPVKCTASNGFPGHRVISKRNAPSGCKDSMLSEDYDNIIAKNKEFCPSNNSPENSESVSQVDSDEDKIVGNNIGRILDKDITGEPDGESVDPGSREHRTITLLRKIGCHSDRVDFTSPVPLAQSESSSITSMATLINLSKENLLSASRSGADNENKRHSKSSQDSVIPCIVEDSMEIDLVKCKTVSDDGGIARTSYVKEKSIDLGAQSKAIDSNKDVEVARHEVDDSTNSQPGSQHLGEDKICVDAGTSNNCVLSKSQSRESLYDNPSADIQDDNSCHSNSLEYSGDAHEYESLLPGIPEQGNHGDGTDALLPGQQRLQDLVTLLSAERLCQNTMPRPASISLDMSSHPGSHRYVNKCYIDTPTSSCRDEFSKKSSISSCNSKGRLTETPSVRDGWSDKFRDTSSSQLIGHGKKKNKWLPWKHLCCISPQKEKYQV